MQGTHAQEAGTHMQSRHAQEGQAPTCKEGGNQEGRCVHARMRVHARACACMHAQVRACACMNCMKCMDCMRTSMQLHACMYGHACRAIA